MEKKKMGRPTSKPMNATIKFRIDTETEEKLAKCSDELKISKSEVLRQGVHKMYDDLDEK